MNTEPTPALVEQQGRLATLIAVATLCVALNVALGAAVFALKLPVYLDAVGTLTCALLAGRLAWKGLALSAAVGASSFIIIGLTLNPVALWFVPTQLAIAVYGFCVVRPVLASRLAGQPLGSKGVALVVGLGLGLGVVAGVVSAPIIALAFGGITGAGASIITSLLLKSGASLYKSVLASGLASEPLDKTLQLVIAVALVRSTPGRVRRLFF